MVTLHTHGVSSHAPGDGLAARFAIGAASLKGFKGAPSASQTDRSTPVRVLDLPLHWWVTGGVTDSSCLMLSSKQQRIPKRSFPIRSNDESRR
jgi:hypothetical protein